jgi:mannosyltransferase
MAPGKMLGLLRHSESTPPLYYCAAWVWARVFGFGQAGLRSLSAVAGVATIPLMYGAAAKLFSRRTGLVVAAVTACAPLLIWYSQEARSYALLVAFSAASLVAFAYALDRPGPRTLMLWAATGALSLATHYYALLVIVPEAIVLMIAHRGRRGQRAVLLAVGAVTLCGIALVPLAITQDATGNSAWIARIPLGPRLNQVIPQFLIGFQSPVQAVIELLAAATAVLGLVLLVLRSDARTRRHAALLGGIAIGGLTLNLALVAAGIDDLITRNVIALWVPAALVLAAGLAARRAGALGLAATAVLCATGIAATIGVASDPRFQRPDWNAVAQVLGPRPPAGSFRRVILIQRYRDLLPLSLDLPGLHFLHGPGADVTQLDVVSISAPRVPLCWWGAACNLSPSSLQGSYSIPGFRVAWRRRAQQFAVVQLYARRPVDVTRAEVARALRTTRLSSDDLLVQS